MDGSPSALRELRPQLPGTGAGFALPTFACACSSSSFVDQLCPCLSRMGPWAAMILTILADPDPDPIIAFTREAKKRQGAMNGRAVLSAVSLADFELLLLWVLPLLLLCVVCLFAHQHMHKPALSLPFLLPPPTLILKLLDRNRQVPSPEGPVAVRCSCYRRYSHVSTFTSSSELKIAGTSRASSSCASSPGPPARAPACLPCCAACAPSAFRWSSQSW